MDNYIDAIIKVRVPEWQIGEEVKIYFKDTMYISGICENLNLNNIWETTEQTSEIKIGDEVQSNYDDGDKYIVTALQYSIHNPKCYACLGGKKVLKTEVHKTGRYFPQIAEILKQI